MALNFDGILDQAAVGALATWAEMEKSENIAEIVPSHLEDDTPRKSRPMWRTAMRPTTTRSEIHPSSRIGIAPVLSLWTRSRWMNHSKSTPIPAPQFSKNSGCLTGYLLHETQVDGKLAILLQFEVPSELIGYSLIRQLSSPLTVWYFADDGSVALWVAWSP